LKLPAWITGLIVSSFLAVGALVGTLNVRRNVRRNARRNARGSLQTGYRQTKPHIGWMLFENDVQTIS
jgi:hypothetical protein